jgi:hypothetical protein
MRTRIANAHDAVAAAKVLRRSIAQLCIADHQNDERFLAGWLANKTPENVASWIANSHVFVAEDGGYIVGVAALTSAGDVTLNYVARRRASDASLKPSSARWRTGRLSLDATSAR